MRVCEYVMTFPPCTDAAMVDHRRYLPYIREGGRERFNRNDLIYWHGAQHPNRADWAKPRREDHALAAGFTGSLYRDLHDLELARIGCTAQGEGPGAGP